MTLQKRCFLLILCIIVWVSDTSPAKKQLNAEAVNNVTNEPYTIVVKNLAGKKISQATFTKKAIGFAKKLYYDLDTDKDGTNLVHVYKGKNVQEKNLLYTKSITKYDEQAHEISSIHAKERPKFINITIDAAKHAKDTPISTKNLSIEIRNILDSNKKDNFFITSFKKGSDSPTDEQPVSSTTHTHRKIKVATEAPVNFVIQRLNKQGQTTDHIITKNRSGWFDAETIKKATKLIIDYRKQDKMATIAGNLNDYIYLE